MISGYQIRLFDPKDRGALEALYQAVYGMAWREKTNLRWTLDCPLVEGGAAVAIDGDTVVSAQPYCDLPLHTPWGPSRATLFLDVATHPAHQRRGLFRRVVAAAREAAFERGTSIITTTPNRLSLRGFMTMSDWVLLCSLDCLFLPLGMGDKVLGGRFMSLGLRVGLSTASLLRRAPRIRSDAFWPSKYDIDTPWLPEVDADELWRSASAYAGIMLVRDRAFLRWRFGADYRLFLMRDHRGPIGYAAARVVTRAGLKIGMVLDCMTVDKGTNALPLLGSVLAWLREQGAAAAMGYFLRESVPWQHICAAGFLRFPHPLAPRKYPVCASMLPGGRHNADLLNQSLWCMSLADSDLA